MRTTAILDGKYVDVSEIDPGKHRFLGMFRPPTPFMPPGCCPLCSCTTVLTTVGDVERHWQLGHSDVAQYASLAAQAEKGTS